MQVSSWGVCVREGKDRSPVDQAWQSQAARPAWHQSLNPTTTKQASCGMPAAGQVPIISFPMSEEMGEDQILGRPARPIPAHEIPQPSGWQPGQTRPTVLTMTVSLPLRARTAPDAGREAICTSHLGARCLECGGLPAWRAPPDALPNPGPGPPAECCGRGTPTPHRPPPHQPYPWRDDAVSRTVDAGHGAENRGRHFARVVPRAGA